MIILCVIYVSLLIISEWSLNVSSKIYVQIVLCELQKSPLFPMPL